MFTIIIFRMTHVTHAAVDLEGVVVEVGQVVIEQSIATGRLSQNSFGG